MSNLSVRNLWGGYELRVGVTHTVLKGLYKPAQTDGCLVAMPVQYWHCQIPGTLIFFWEMENMDL